MITKLVPVEYDQGATCPFTWLSFLQTVLAGNAALIKFLQKAIGYALTGSTREQSLFFLYGLGANGKSTLLDIILRLLADYGKRTSGETFLVKKGGQIPNDIAALRGARFVAAVEVESGRRLAEVLIKEMTGGDTISARFLHAEFFEFKPEFKIFLAANHKPVIRGTDHAIWRRVHLIPFDVQIPEEQQDKELPAKLQAELPGILNWAIEGCLLWQREGLMPPQEVTEATEGYREEMDPISDFIAECCIVAPGASVKAKELYGAYTEWAEDNKEKKPLSLTAFGLTLTDRGFQKGRGSAGVWFRYGIGLKVRE
jgi:putative DNA primase/helicase